MATKRTESEMSFQYWVRKLSLAEGVASGIKQAYGILGCDRLKKSAFKTLVNDWLTQPSNGDTHD